MPKAVEAVEVVAAELALVQQERAQQGLVAVKEEPARRPEAVEMLSVEGHQPERSVEARQRERLAEERRPTALRRPHRDRLLLKHKRRLRHPPATLRPPAESSVAILEPRLFRLR